MTTSLFKRPCNRRAVLLGGGSLLAVAGAGPARAQAWPARAITTVVPLGAGSASDVIARLVMDQISRQIGQTIVVENRPGAGGTLGASMVAKSAADGYTILCYGALASAHALYARLPYDTLKDFIPVIPLGQQPLVVITAPSKGYRTLRDLIAAAKAKPGDLNYSTAGVGSASHFGAERLRAAAGFTAQHVPFRGAAEAVTEVVAGRADFSLQLGATSLSLVRDGKLAVLAVSAEQRASVLPEVPTMIEAGLTGDATYPFWTGLFVPAQTPRDIVVRLHTEAAKALQAPNVQERFKQIGVEPMPMDMEQFAKFFRDDVEANVKLVQTANIPRQQ